MEQEDVLDLLAFGFDSLWIRFREREDVFDRADESVEVLIKPRNSSGPVSLLVVENVVPGVKGPSSDIAGERPCCIVTSVASTAV